MGRMTHGIDAYPSLLRNERLHEHMAKTVSGRVKRTGCDGNADGTPLGHELGADGTGDTVAIAGAFSGAYADPVATEYQAPQRIGSVGQHFGAKRIVYISPPFDRIIIHISYLP
jgi:hypothetical protein